jgi:hypothetical protein
MLLMTCLESNKRCAGLHKGTTQPSKSQPVIQHSASPRPPAQLPTLSGRGPTPYPVLSLIGVSEGELKALSLHLTDGADSSHLVGEPALPLAGEEQRVGLRGTPPVRVTSLEEWLEADVFSAYVPNVSLSWHQTGRSTCK